MWLKKIFFDNVTDIPKLGIFLLLFAGSILAEEKRPRWELGVGIGSLRQADYLGADESTTYTTFFPFAVFRTPEYSVDRDGIKGSLVGGERLGLGLSFGGTLPVDSSENAARKGMDDLDPTFEIGPNPHVQLYSNTYSKINFELPVRVSLNLSSGRYEGATVTPRWVWRSRWRDISTALSATAIISNRRYHDRVYTINQGDTSASRQQYQAKGGYSGSRFSWSINRRTPHYLAGFFVAYTHLGAAVNRESDLLADDENLSYGIVATWIFGRSKNTVSVGSIGSDNY